MKLFYKTNRYGKYSITISAVESWNNIQKQLKNIYLKNYPPIRLKQLSLIFILNHINNSIDHTKIGAASRISMQLQFFVNVLFWASGDNLDLKCPAILVSKLPLQLGFRGTQSALEHLKQPKDLRFDSNNHST